jgi:Zn-dependent M28 family amino/carboxypeptidase
VLVFALLAVSGASAGVITAWLVLLWVFSVPLMLSVVGARNDGTLDNASGVATVLDAVERLPREMALGVVVTDAEELALAGAAAWVRDQAAGIAINVDSVDDDGDLVAMYSGVAPAAVVSALQAEARAEGEPIRVIRLIPGILTDHVPLRAAGWRTLTLSRGTIRTLMRIHTSRDTLSYMDGRGIDGAARVLARTVTELS